MKSYEEREQIAARLYEVFMRETRPVGAKPKSWKKLTDSKVRRGFMAVARLVCDEIDNAAYEQSMAAFSSLLLSSKESVRKA